MNRRATRRCPPQNVDPADAGITLVELMVSMALMSVVTTVFLGGIMQIHRSVNRAEAMSVAQSQINTAFLRLDSELRYAADISEPGPGYANAKSVEFLTYRAGAPNCVQLQLTDAGILRRREWTPPASPNATIWATVVSEVSSAEPFEVLQADNGANVQRLRLKLTAESQNAGITRHIDMTFAALNTSLGAADPTVCREGRSIA